LSRLVVALEEAASKGGCSEDWPPYPEPTSSAQPAGRMACVDLVHFLVDNVVVKRVNIHDAKTNLSRYLAELTPGEALVLCKRNQPVAEVRLLRKKPGPKPRIGVAKGRFEVPDSFFEPLPDEILNAFTGK
jgi:antitoxin (DNA-binding transcriptional repressor) of toxin-antitoxin stability system